MWLEQDDSREYDGEFQLDSLVLLIYRGAEIVDDIFSWTFLQNGEFVLVCCCCLKISFHCCNIFNVKRGFKSHWLSQSQHVKFIHSKWPTIPRGSSGPVPGNHLGIKPPKTRLAGNRHHFSFDTKAGFCHISSVSILCFLYPCCKSNVLISFDLCCVFGCISAADIVIRHLLDLCVSRTKSEGSGEMTSPPPIGSVTSGLIIMHP